MNMSVGSDDQPGSLSLSLIKYIEYCGVMIMCVVYITLGWRTLQPGP